MPDLHPAVEHLLHSGRYQCRPAVEVFTEHELRNAKGEVTRKVTKDDLEQIAGVNNNKAANGALTPVGAGHTFDDEYDANGQLVRKFPEEQQPKPLGYGLNWRVAPNPHTGKYSLFYDEWIQSQIEDPENPGRFLDGLKYTATFPRRSVEHYAKEAWIDWVALLRRAPRLDIGLELYSKQHPDKTSYARSRDGFDAPVITMARGKQRYSFDTGGEMDPTAPPTADPAPTPPSGDTNANPVDISTMPEHKEAAEAYARYTHGMHNSRIAPLMKHLHNQYAAACGMTGDMNTPYAMGAPSPTSAMPGVAPAATPAAPSTPPVAPATPHVPEHQKMQHDQAAIEKERYERRLADLEAGLAAERAARQQAEERALKSYYERQIMQLVHEGYEGIDAAKEMETVEKRKYSKQQFDDYISDLRRLPKAPISSGGRIDPHSHELQRPMGPEQTQSDKYAKHFEKIQRYIRQGKSSAEAYELACGEKWNGKEVLNGK